ncbi:hypothetical protein ZOSMA_170G00220 [Zostera marina]|uniref:Uncharacterized protein n=1 Tax=Zostera marina TaxID=29655 RepID=A0A0K9PSP9_ZOSMR|nr:hypothetical protein ZOSMA_170G00220 [Zostera marina]
MDRRRPEKPTAKIRQVLGDVTNRNIYSRRSGKKVPKSPECGKIAPHFHSVESSTGSVECFSQGGDFPSNVALTNSLGKKRKSATISEDYDEKNRNLEMKKKTRKKNKKAIIVEGTKQRPSSGPGDIRSNSDTTLDPLSKHNTEELKLDPEIKKLRDYYEDIDAYELIEEESSTPTKTKTKKTWTGENTSINKL